MRRQSHLKMFVEALELTGELLKIKFIYQLYISLVLSNLTSRKNLKKFEKKNFEKKIFEKKFRKI